MAEIMELNVCLAAGCCFMGAAGAETAAGCWPAIPGVFGSAQPSCLLSWPLPASASCHCFVLTRSSSLSPHYKRAVVATWRTCPESADKRKVHSDCRPLQPFPKSPFRPLRASCMSAALPLSPLILHTLLRLLRLLALLLTATSGTQCPTGGRQERSQYAFCSSIHFQYLVVCWSLLQLPKSD